MHDPFDASTIIFALLAIFVVWKLRSVLGTRVTIERKRDAAPTWRGPAPPDAAARDGALPGAAPVEPPPPPPPPPPVTPAASIDAPTLAASRGIEEIRRADRSFDIQGFMTGAQAAYRMIIEAFSRGDRAQLGNLLGDDALRTFTAALDERGDTPPATLTQVADIEKVQVVNAALQGSMAVVTLRFKAHIAETPVGGGPGQTSEANDIWTFARDTRSSDPNWKLVDTSTDETPH